MNRLIKAILTAIKNKFDTLFNRIADGIELKVGAKIATNIFLVILWGVVYSICCIGIIYLAVRLWPIALVVAIVASWLYNRSCTKDEEISAGDDEVEVELVRQRAREMYDEVHSIMFQAIQGAASITPLLRPHDLYEIECSSARGDHFYMLVVQNGNKKVNIPVYQFECELEAPIDKSQNDIIQRELQRYLAKQAARYPLLISPESQGRSPLEVLDIKNMGGHIVCEIVHTTAASIPLIEARRRARVERQQRQQAFTDADYPE